MAKVKEIGTVEYRKNASPVAFTLMNKSNSSDKVYKLNVYENGSISCNCPGWIFNSRRQCKHTFAAIEKIAIRAGKTAVA